MQVSRDGKMPVAIYKGGDAIMSPAYPMFEVCSDQLLPDYLQLWFSRDEFDREATFYAVGGVRGSLDWDDFMDMRLPIPSVEEQRRIVAEYQAIGSRIALIEKLISKLQECATTIFAQTCTLPSTLSALPEGWCEGKLGDVAQDVSKNIKKETRNNYPYYLPIDCLPRKMLVYSDVRPVEEAESSIISFSKNDIIMGAMRPYFHKVVVARDPGLTRSTCMVLNAKNKAYWAYLVMLMFSEDTINYATANSLGSTMPYVNWKIMSQMKVVIPPINVVERFSVLFAPVYSYMSDLVKESIVLKSLQEMLLCGVK